MIFVTVGTHEQPFDRLIKCIDMMVEMKKINEEVIVQKGFTDYDPKYCKAYKLIGYNEMQKYIQDARIVVTHGGPASFLAPISIGKIPIVVPRQLKYNEHINDHQLEFSKAVAEKMKNIIVAETEEEIMDSILNYESKIKMMTNILESNNERFIEKLENEINKLF